MQLSCLDLPTYTQLRYASLYVVHGGEPLQTMEAMEWVRAEAQKQGYTGNRRYEITPQFDWEAVLTDDQSFDLFESKQLIEFHLSTGKLQSKSQQALLDIISRNNKNHTILCIADKLSTATLKSKWMQSLLQQALVITAKPIPPHELPQWLAERFKQCNLKVEPEICHKMSDWVEGHLLAAHQTIVKLQLLDLKEPLSWEDVASCLENEAQFSTFDLVEALLKRDPTRTFNIFQSLRKEKVEPAFILWVITREVRLLLQIANDRQKGRSWTDIATQHRLWGSRTAVIQSSLSQLTLTHIQTLLHRAHQVDMIIKGINPGNVWQALRGLCVNLLGFSTVIEEVVSTC